MNDVSFWSELIELLHKRGLVKIRHLETDWERNEISRDPTIFHESLGKGG